MYANFSSVNYQELLAGNMKENILSDSGETMLLDRIINYLQKNLYLAELNNSFPSRKIEN